MIIGPFKDHYKFLSNMYIAPFKVHGVTYRSVENYYQAHKTLNKEYFEKIRVANPYEAKKLGKRVKLRDDWNRVKIVVMLEGVFYKFFTDKFLRQKLLDTGNTTLVEKNWWHDNYWGDCWCEKCSNIEGKNILGKILMIVREILKEEIV